MICPNCKYEYVKGIKTCPDCGRELIEIEEFEKQQKHESDWIVLTTTDSFIEAETLKTNLESAEIETQILSQRDSSFPGVGDLSVIKVLVGKEDAEDALAILNDISSRSEE